MMFPFILTVAMVAHGLALTLAWAAHEIKAPDWMVFGVICAFATGGAWATWLAATLP